MFPLLLLSALAAAQPPAAAPATAAAPAAAPAPAPPAAPATAQVSSTPVTIVFPLRAVNIGADDVRGAEILFRKRYETALGYPLVTEEATRASVTAADDIGLLQACQSLGCGTWVTVDLVRLDAEVFVTVTVRDGQAGIRQHIETTAAGADALPLLFDRIAKAIAQNVPLDQIPVSRPAGAPVTRLDQADAPETDAPRPHPDVDSLVGFKFGLLGPLWPNFGISITHTFTWRRVKADRFFELDAGLTLPLGLSDDRDFWTIFLEVGLARLFPLNTSTAFYAGGGLGPRAGGYDNLGVGVGVYGQAGLMFGRDHSMQPYIQWKLGGDAFTGYGNPYVISYTGVEAGVGF